MNNSFDLICQTCLQKILKLFSIQFDEFRQFDSIVSFFKDSIFFIALVMGYCIRQEAKRVVDKVNIYLQFIVGKKRANVCHCLSFKRLQVKTIYIKNIKKEYQNMGTLF